MDEPGGSRFGIVGVDLVLGGRLRLRQPRSGHRAGTDAILLSACAAVRPGDRFVDVGAGAGTVGLAIARREPGVTGVLLDIDAATTEIAGENCALNELAGRVRAVRADLFDPHARRDAGLPNEDATLVVTNPPFHLAQDVRASGDPARARAHVLDEATGHEAWMRAALALLAPKGRFYAIHRPEALPALCASWDGRLGGVALMPVYARPGGEAIRILVSGVKGSRAPARIVRPFTLHAEDGRFTPEAEAVHHGATIAMA